MRVLGIKVVLEEEAWVESVGTKRHDRSNTKKMMVQSLIQSMALTLTLSRLALAIGV